MKRLDPADINSLRLAEGNRRGNPNVTIVSEAGMYEDDKGTRSVRTPSGDQENG